MIEILILEMFCIFGISELDIFSTIKVENVKNIEITDLE